MTKTADCLFEIFAEELPPKAQKNLAEALHLQITERLQKENLTFTNMQVFATPRRLAVLIKDLIGQQPDQVVERKGPAVNAAFDKDGVATKACEGFARSFGVSPKELITLKSEQGEWVGYRQEVAGKSTQTLLPAILEQAVAALPITKRMRWGDKAIEFVRPVHSIILMYGQEVVPATILGCEAGHTTRGHRFMADQSINITAPAEYENVLQRDGKVVADFTKRRAMVHAAVGDCLQAVIKDKGTAVMSDALLDEVTSLVEYPVPLCGTFDADFLNVPKEVLISSMQDHQRYFPVVAADGTLLPYFVTVSNIESKNPEQVIHGNERVLRARLSDAKFFYESDQHEKLADRLPRLKEIVYQAKLGTLHDKAERLQLLTAHISEQMGVASDDAGRAGLLAKADLVTNMVGEFPELQGVMGGYYAALSENKAVADAIRDQYLPRFAGDVVPTSPLGSALALADRIDLLMGSFLINQIPTGDKDPFGLRRAALGIVRILIEGNIDIDLAVILDKAKAANLKQIGVEATGDQAALVFDFIRERMRAWYQDQGITPDVFAAVAALGSTNLLDFHKRIHAVQAFKKLQEAEALSAANKRVSNILAKYQEAMQADAINPAHFEDQVEAELSRQLELKQGEVERLCQTGQYNDVLLQLASLRQPIDNFFDKVMVMDEKRERRENRILLLKQLRQMFLRVADIALLQ